MLDSFYIKNFRLFKELKIKTLGRVNLITGKNNSGKSCFLEALRVYAENASPQLLYDLVEDRGEDWEAKAKLRANVNNVVSELKNPLRHLFYCYQFPTILEEGIQIGSLNNSEDNIKLALTVYEFENRRNFSYPLQEISQNMDILFPELIIEIEINPKHKKYLVILSEYERPFKYGKLQSTPPKLSIQFVPTYLLGSDDVHVLWDNINIKPSLRKEVFNTIRLIDNKIQEIVVTSDSTPIIIYSNETQIPLRSLGDGAIHLFHIILALVNVKDGMLLIDEFENGLHYSVQPKIWEVIFKLAETLNIQVFATTHSRDCIRAFHEIWSKPENNDKGCFFRLDHYPEKDIIRPMFYDLEILGDALDVNGEMR